MDLLDTPAVGVLIREHRRVHCSSTVEVEGKEGVMVLGEYISNKGQELV